MENCNRIKNRNRRLAPLEEVEVQRIWKEYLEVPVYKCSFNEVQRGNYFGRGIKKRIRKLKLR